MTLNEWVSYQKQVNEYLIKTVSDLQEEVSDLKCTIENMSNELKQKEN